MCCIAMTWIICDREVSGFDSESRVGVQMGSVCTENRKNVYLTRECRLYRLHDVLSWVGTLRVEKKLCKEYKTEMNEIIY